MFGAITDKKTLVFNGNSGSIFTATYPCIVYWIPTVKPPANPATLVTCIRTSGARSFLAVAFRDCYGCYLEIGDRITVSTYGSQYRLVIMRYL